MSITMILAISDNNVIGIGDKLPWHIKEDLARFKSLTMDSICIMGRKTYESMRPYFKDEILPNRTKYVLSRNTFNDKHAKQITIDEIFNLEPSKNINVIGGAEIYQLLFEYIDTISLTRVHTTITDNDSVVYNLDLSEFELIYKVSSRNIDFKYDFETWKRNIK